VRLLIANTILILIILFFIIICIVLLLNLKINNNLLLLQFIQFNLIKIIIYLQEFINEISIIQNIYYIFLNNNK